MSTWEGCLRATWEQGSWPPRIRLAFAFPEGSPWDPSAQGCSVLLGPLRHGEGQIPVPAHIWQIGGPRCQDPSPSDSQVRTLGLFSADGEG